MGSRLTLHNGRMARETVRHLDRDNITAEHIDENRKGQNKYWNIYDGDYSGRTKKPHLSFQDVERKVYDERFENHIKDVNERAIKSGHMERKISSASMLKSKKTMPEETVLQIGSTRDDVANSAVFWQIWTKFLQWHRDTYPQIEILDCALHMDEAYPHIHYRRMYWYDDNGIIREGQEKALEQMGIPMPVPGSERSRTNNRKQTYSAQVREKLMEICCEFGYEIIDKPLEDRKHNLKKEEAIIQELKFEKESLVKEKESLAEENENLKRQIQYANAFNEFVDEAERQRTKSRSR